MRRNIFYQAQCWRNFGDLEKAYTLYCSRSKMGGYEEEVWYSLFMMACILQALDGPPEEAIKAYLEAYDYRSSRAEPLRVLAEYQRKLGNEKQWRINHEIADMIPMTTDQLFVVPSAYVAGGPIMASSDKNMRMRST